MGFLSVVAARVSLLRFTQMVALRIKYYVQSGFAPPALFLQMPQFLILT